jgi:hypothetical protein
LFPLQSSPVALFKSFRTPYKTGSKPFKMPSFDSSFVISGTFSAIYFIHDEILSDLSVLPSPIA